jgi:hypothetical protein
MSKADPVALHRGTDIAIVACLVLGELTLSVLPFGLLGLLLGPSAVPLWREAVVFAGSIVVGSAMLVMARSLSRRRRWARSVAIVVLATWTLAIGAFSLSVARSEEAGHGAGYVILGGFQLGGLAFAGTLGLAARGAAADFRARKTYAVVLPDPPPPIR